MRWYRGNEHWAGRQNSGNHWSWTEKTNRNEDGFRDLWNHIKHRNIWILGVPGGEEREKGAENTSEDILAEHFANLGKEMGILEHRVPNKKKTTARHIVIRMAKIKAREGILKAAQEEQQVTNKKLCMPEGCGLIYLK